MVQYLVSCLRFLPNRMQRVQNIRTISIDFGTLKHWHLSQEFKKWFPQDLDFKGHEFIA